MIEEPALEHERATCELETAKHLQHSANHVCKHEVPRAWAQVVAIVRHLKNAPALLDRLTVLHASKAVA